MHVRQNVVHDMLSKISNPQMREIYGGILAGEITGEVRCMSEDQYTDIEVEALDDNGEKVYYKSGKRKGEVKTEKKRVLYQEGCKGRAIAHITANGAVIELEPVANDNEYNPTVYKSGLEGSRERLDGQMGFRCYCGNSSILCEEEQGIITPAVPTQSDLQKIADRLGKRKPNLYLPKNGKTKIDGFEIVEVKA